MMAIAFGTIEEWLPSGHLRYEVSSEGRVKSYVGREPRILTPVVDNHGYLTVRLHSRRYKIHRLVCEAFHGPPPAKADAAHLDGDRTNNAAANLAWASRKENMAHKRLHGTHQTGESHGSAKLTTAQVSEARERAASGESHKSIARSLGVSGTQIDRIVSGSQWVSARWASVNYRKEERMTAADTTLNRCSCGAEISRWSVRCNDCRVKSIIAAATTVEPSTPLNLVDSDTFFHDFDEAIEFAPGSYAHPCDEEPLCIRRPKRTAAELAERVVEEMCEEAFEDAADHAQGVAELEAAFEAALEKFNTAQTSSSWTPRTNEVFAIPAVAKGAA